jgi:hypothetical protein
LDLEIGETIPLLGLSAGELWVTGSTDIGSPVLHRLTVNGWDHFTMGPEVISIDSIARDPERHGAIFSVTIEPMDPAIGRDSHQLWTIRGDGGIETVGELAGTGVAVASTNSLAVVAVEQGGTALVQGFTPRTSWEKRIPGSAEPSALDVDGRVVVVVANRLDNGVPIGAVAFRSEDSGATWALSEFEPNTHASGSVAIVGGRVAASVVTEGEDDQVLVGGGGSGAPWEPLTGSGDGISILPVDLNGDGAWVVYPEHVQFVPFLDRD